MSGLGALGRDRENALDQSRVLGAAERNSECGGQPAVPRLDRHAAL